MEETLISRFGRDGDRPKGAQLLRCPARHKLNMARLRDTSQLRLYEPDCRCLGGSNDLIAVALTAAAMQSDNSTRFRPAGA